MGAVRVFVRAHPETRKPAVRTKDFMERTLAKRMRLSIDNGYQKHAATIGLTQAVLTLHDGVIEV